MKKVIATLMASAMAISSYGAWTLMDDFQQWNDGDIFTEGTDIGWNASCADGTDEYWMLADPHDPDNIAMFIESGNYGVGYGSTYVVKELPGGGIAPGATGTIYLRCLWSGLGNNWHVGTSDRALAYDAVTGIQTVPGAWGDYNAMIRLGDAVNIEHRDGGGYVSTNPPVIVEVNNWYSFWIVVENSWDMSTTPATSTGTHTLYMKGPGVSDAPTLIPVGTDPVKDSAFIRRAPLDDDGNPQAIIWLMFATNSGPPGTPNPGDPYLLDDFYFSQGMNISIPGETPPPPTTWGGYDIINEAGDVDTGDWLGWINVGSAPYVYSYGLGWIYMVEPAADAAGSWSYVYK